MSQAVVVLGPPGAGKSSLVNKLTDAKLSTGGNVVGSVSQVSKLIPIPDTNVVLLDTPGREVYCSGGGDELKSLESHISKNQHMMMSLSCMPLSAIMILVPFSPDRTNIINNVRDLLSLFKRVPEHVMIFVTHWDLVLQHDPNLDLEDQERQVKAALKFSSVKPDHMFFIGKDTPASTVKALLLASLCAPKKFAPSNFRVPPILVDLDMSVQNAISDLQDDLEAWKKTVAGWADAPGKDSALACAIGIAADYCNDVLKQFSDEEHSAFFETVEMVYVAHHTMFLRVQQMQADFRIWCMLRMKCKAQNQTYRCCPNCGQMWVKTEGCDRETKCGARPSMKDMEDVKTSWFVRVVNRSLVWDQGETSAAENKEYTKEDKQKLHAKSGQGCGATITWTTMLDPPPALLEELRSATETTDPTEIVDKLTKSGQETKFKTLSASVHNNTKAHFAAEMTTKTQKLAKTKVSRRRK